MEPRPHERGKLIPAVLAESQALLQWSHVLTNVESGVPVERFLVNARFNGATSSRTWKVAANERHSLPMGGFNGATSSRTWKAGCRAGSASCGRRFNGATSSRTWKAYFPQAGRGRLRASMEPRPHERGKDPRRDGNLRGTTASMEPRPHERGKI